LRSLDPSRQWNDPVSSLYTRWQQNRLFGEYGTFVREHPARPIQPRADPAAIARLAAEPFRDEALHPVG